MLAERVFAYGWTGLDKGRDDTNDCLQSVISGAQTEQVVVGQLCESAK